MTGKVAIIILNWNASEVTIDCLKSLEKIDYSNFRIFLIDNASNDTEYQLIDRYCKEKEFVRLIPLAYNYGFAEGNNIGIRYAVEEFSPDYFLLLNNDTVVYSNFLSLLVAAIAEKPKIGIAVPKIFFYDEPDYLYYAGGYINPLSGMGEHYGWRQKDNGEFNSKREVGFANGCCMLISNELYSNIGMLNGNFFANIEDVEYSYRTVKANFGIIYVPKSTIKHKEGYASKKNKGQWFRIYLSTRNLILFYKERARWFHIFLFLPYFSLRWIVYMSCKSLLSKDFKSVKAIWRGVCDGITNKLSYVELPSHTILRKNN